MAQVNAWQETGRKISSRDMIFGFEALLIAGAWTFYVWDASILLFVDELVLELSGRKCHVRSGAVMLVGGKRPFIPNPLTPYHPQLLATADDLLGAGTGIKSDDLAHYLDALKPFQMLSIALLLMFVIALPVVLYWFGTGTELLYWLAMVYLLVGCIAYHTWRRRLVLGLSKRASVLLAFECLACTPFAINIVRKLTLRHGVAGLHRLKAICGQNEFRALKTAIERHINRTLSQYDVTDAAALKLSEYRQKLVAGSDP